MSKITQKDIMHQQEHIVEDIVKDEKWYESEKRGEDVGEKDPAVQQHVAEVIMRDGAHMREVAIKELLDEGYTYGEN